MAATPGLSIRKSRKKNTVDVVTYNILSSKLSNPSYFTSCKPEYCDPQYRIEQILEKINTEIDKQAVICLQEISQDYAGELHTHFSQNDYYFVHSSYGNKFNGYMGVGIAVPLAKFEIEEIDITRIADTKFMPKKPEPSIFARLWDLIMSFITFFLKLIGSWKEEKDPWGIALSRYNHMLCMRLRFKKSKGSENRSIVIGNYHMPCVFYVPQVMSIHCALAAQHISKFAKGDAYIFCGDFNIKPFTSQYELMTKGTIEKSNPDHPPAIEGDLSLWECKVYPPLVSAYAQYEGAEPNFTNYARIRDEPVFVEVLDYIFLSQTQTKNGKTDSDWIVNDVLKLPHRDEVEGPLPNKTEPSDHILISAELQML